jgi:glutaminase
LLQRALNDDLAIPQWAKFCESLVKIYNEVKALPLSGKNATYIPELGAADPTKFGFSVCTVDGQVFTHGAQDDFPIESCATSFLYSLLVESMGYENVRGNAKLRFRMGTLITFQLDSSINMWERSHLELPITLLLLTS